MDDKVKKHLFIISFLLLLGSYGFGQSDMSKAMIDMDSRLTTYEIIKTDTTFSESGKMKKVRYYNPINKIRKTILYYENGTIKEIFNVNEKHQLDGILLEIYENGKIKHYGIYNNGVGFSYDYYEDGRIKIYSQSKDTYTIGYKATFCSEGELYSETFYDSTGYSFTGYHCNGNLRVKGRNETDYINKVGKWEYWNKEAVLIKTEHWEKGKLIKEEEIELK